MPVWVKSGFFGQFVLEFGIIADTPPVPYILESSFTSNICLVLVNSIGLYLYLQPLKSYIASKLTMLKNKQKMQNIWPYGVHPRLICIFVILLSH